MDASPSQDAIVKQPTISKYSTLAGSPSPIIPPPWEERDNVEPGVFLGKHHNVKSWTQDTDLLIKADITYVSEHHDCMILDSIPCFLITTDRLCFSTG